MNWSPYYVTAASVLCILTGILRFGELSNRLKILLIFLIVIVGLEELIVVLSPEREDEYRWIRHLYIFQRPFEYGIYASVVLEAVRFPKAGIYIRATALAFLGYVAVLFLTGNTGESSLSTTFILIGIGSIAVSLVYFRSVMTSPVPVSLHSDPAFWVATALLFFYSGNIIVTGLYPQLLLISEELAKLLYKSVTLSLGVVNYLLFAIAFFIGRKPPPGNADQ